MSYRSDPVAALAELRTGNARFVANVRTADVVGEVRRAELRDSQQPFAIILGCSDSRVPAEIVFDQGLGDLFVIRVAGNIVAPSQLGSVEFAIERFGTPLVVVLGHSRCGAITATVDVVRGGPAAASRNIMAIVDRIRPAIEPLTTGRRRKLDDLVAAGVRANVRASVNQLRHGSANLETLEAAGRLLIVGAEYDLDTGAVDFFDMPKVRAVAVPARKRTRR